MIKCSPKWPTDWLAQPLPRCRCGDRNDSAVWLSSPCLSLRSSAMTNDPSLWGLGLGGDFISEAVTDKDASGFYYKWQRPLCVSVCVCVCVSVCVSVCGLSASDDSSMFFSLPTPTPRSLVFRIWVPVENLYKYTSLCRNQALYGTFLDNPHWVIIQSHLGHLTGSACWSRQHNGETRIPGEGSSVTRYVDAGQVPSRYFPINKWKQLLSDTTVAQMGNMNHVINTRPLSSSRFSHMRNQMSVFLLNITENS